VLYVCLKYRTTMFNRT